MPIKPKTKRSTRRKLAKNPTIKRRRRQRLSKGFLTLRRKTAPCYVTNSATAGSPTAVAGSGVNANWLQLGTPVAVNGLNYDVPFSMQFTMSDIIAYTDVTNLCDQYRINNVQVSINYNSNSADVNGPSSMPGIYYITDDDDAGVTTVNAVRQRMGLKYKSWGSNRTHVSMGVRPKVAPLLYGPGGTTGYAIPLRATWINTLSDSVPHYGIRGYFTNVYLPSSTSKDQSVLFTFDITYSVSGKDFD